MDNKKIMTLSYMIGAVLVWVTVDILMTAAAAASGFMARLHANDFVNHGVPVVFGLVCFFVLQFNPGVSVWAEEVVVEIRKVVWPSRKDTIATTIFVVVLVLISGVLLGIFDVVSSYFVNKLIAL